MKKSYLFILTLSAAYSFAQTNILQQFHNESSLVIEGKIIGSSSYFDSNGDIFTNYEVQTSQLLKGDSDSIVILKALGGIVDDHFQVVSHQLKFKLNDECIFFINKNISSNTYKIKYHERFINYRKTHYHKKPRT